MRRWIILILLLLALAGCRAVNTPEITATLPPATTTAPAPVVRETPIPPTEVPAALRVNGETIPLSEFNASLAQLQSAQPNLDAADQRQRVLDDLVDQTLLAQAAASQGYALDETSLDERIAALAQQMGGEPALLDWQERMGYDRDSFRSALRRAAAAAWMRDQILAAVPQETEQVHARQILLRNEETARQVEQQAKAAGTNFATLAAGYDLATRGDLYWFPRGYLNEPAVEEAAFSLQPGEISGVIQSSIGYHILQVVAKEVRPLSADARMVLQRKALADWLAEKRPSAQVEILVP